MINKKTGGFMDQIRCDEPSYLIWKWHPSGVRLGEGNRETAVRNGSSLRVKDGELAVFVYNRGNGVYQDFIEGPFDEKIKSKNLPVLASLVGLAFEGGTPFQAEIYFINLAGIIQIPFAVPYFDIYDPRFTDFGVPTAVRGRITFNIKDYRGFIKLHRLNNFDLKEFEIQVRSAVVQYVKGIVENIPAKRNIPVIQLEREIDSVNAALEESVRNRFEKDFGVNITAVDINAIEIDKSSEGYYRLMAVTRDITAAKVKAETEDYVERIRIKREEEQYAMHKQTQSANIGAFQLEKQTEVGIAGAEAIGKMGEHGGGSIDLGGNTGFNPAAMMAGMAVGGAVGQNIAGTMNGIMTGSAQQTVPPEIPKTLYNVAVDGKPTGPYDINTLAQMAQSGSICAETLVWKPGMANWSAISNVAELSEVIKAVPPEIK